MTNDGSRVMVVNRKNRHLQQSYPSPCVVHPLCIRCAEVSFVYPLYKIFKDVYQIYIGCHLVSVVFTLYSFLNNRMTSTLKLNADEF